MTINNRRRASRVGGLTSDAVANTLPLNLRLLSQGHRSNNYQTQTTSMLPKARCIKTHVKLKPFAVNSCCLERSRSIVALKQPIRAPEQRAHHAFHTYRMPQYMQRRYVSSQLYKQMRLLFIAFDSPGLHLLAHSRG